MHMRRILLWVFKLVFTALLALPLLTFPSYQARRRQTVYIVAARDSHLLTMCPGAGEVKMPGGQTWKSDNNVVVTTSGNYQLLDFLFAVPRGPSSVTLPLPAFPAPSGQSGGSSISAGRDTRSENG